MRSILYSVLGSILVLSSCGFMQAMGSNGSDDAHIEMEVVPLDHGTSDHEQVSVPQVISRVDNPTLTNVQRLIAAESEHKQQIRRLKWGYRVTVALLCVGSLTLFITDRINGNKSWIAAVHTLMLAASIPMLGADSFLSITGT